MLSRLTDDEESILEATSPIQSLNKRPAEEIPEPPQKRQRTEEQFKTVRNRIATLQTRKAKTAKSLAYISESRRKVTCPVGLQYRPRPHVRSDQPFQTALRQICREAEQKVLTLIAEQQQSNIKEDEKQIRDLDSQLTKMFPDVDLLKQARNRTASATRRQTARTNRPFKPAKQQQSSSNLADVEAKFKELQTLMYSLKNNLPNSESNKTRDSTYTRVSFPVSHKFRKCAQFGSKYEA